MIGRVDHVGIVVRDLQAALTFYEGLLGRRCSRTEEIPEQGVTVAFLPTGDSEIELLTPNSTDSGVARFLEKRGEGMHHICLEVDDIEVTLAEMTARGVPLIDEVPRQGTVGRVAFIHPKGANGVLIELIERSKRG